MAHVVRLQMLIEYNFRVTIIWCPKFIPCTRLRCAYNWAYETNRYYHCLVSVAVVSLLPWRLSSRNPIWRTIHKSVSLSCLILVIALLWSLFPKENNKNFTVKTCEEFRIRLSWFRGLFSCLLLQDIHELGAFFIF